MSLELIFIIQKFNSDWQIEFMASESQGSVTSNTSREEMLSAAERHFSFHQVRLLTPTSIHGLLRGRSITCKNSEFHMLLLCHMYNAAEVERGAGDHELRSGSEETEIRPTVMRFRNRSRM